MSEQGSRRKFRPKLWPTIGLVLGLGVLLSLGTWQFLRYRDASKRESRQEKRLAESPLEIASVDALTPDVDYRRVEAKGRLDDRIILFKNRVRGSHTGYWLAQPLVFADGSAVLVNRGWFPARRGEKYALELLPDDPEDTYTGLVHTLDFVVKDGRMREVVGEELPTGEISAWMSLDLDAIYDALPYETPTRPTMIVLGPDHSGDPFPKASYEFVTEPYLTAEKHIGYSTTWYLLALALLAIWVAHGFGLLRPGAAGPYQIRRENGD